jgi:spermidine synthase
MQIKNTGLIMTRKFLFLIFLVGCCVVPCRAELDEKTILFSGESPYASIRVFETVHGYRAMAIGSLWQTVINPRDPEEVFFAYSRTAFAGLALRAELPREILFIGLGGGSMASYLKKKLPTARFTVAEIDPLVVDLAIKYFNINSNEFSFYKQDGRQFLRKTTNKYDFVIADAFRGDEVPFHLTTVEFMSTLKSTLTDEGVVAFHLWEQKNNKYFVSQLATIQKVFPKVYLFYAGDGSYIVFATKSETIVDKSSWERRGEELSKKLSMSYDLGSIISRQYSLLETQDKDAVILTDDYAPVNQLRERD